MMNTIGYAIARGIAIILLLCAVDRHPYSYYTLLRLVVCSVSLYSAYFYYKVFHDELNIWVWIFGAIAVLFNPIKPIYLDKYIWQYVDFAVAAILSASLLFDFIKRKKRHID